MAAPVQVSEKSGAGGAGDAGVTGDGDAEKEEAIVVDGVNLGATFFPVRDREHAERVDKYRRDYMAFRAGRANGARGEPNDVANPSNEDSTPSSSQSRPPPFLVKLSAMLDDPAGNECIRWTDDGTGIIVEKLDKFSAEVLPRYFKHGNFSSFLRQLNMYHFYTTAQKRGEWRVFTNPMFVRGSRDVHNQIQRKALRLKRGSSGQDAKAAKASGTRSSARTRSRNRQAADAAKSAPPPPVSAAVSVPRLESTDTKKLITRQASQSTASVRSDAAKAGSSSQEQRSGARTGGGTQLATGAARPATSVRSQSHAVSVSRSSPGSEAGVPHPDAYLLARMEEMRRVQAVHNEVLASLVPSLRRSGMISAALSDKLGSSLSSAQSSIDGLAAVAKAGAQKNAIANGMGLEKLPMQPARLQAPQAAVKRPSDALSSQATSPPKRARAGSNDPGVGVSFGPGSVPPWALPTVPSPSTSLSAGLDDDQWWWPTGDGAVPIGLLPRDGGSSATVDSFGILDGDASLLGLLDT